MDYDYLDKLTDAERQWLAAFTEEHVKGFRLKGETQVTTREAINAANAARMRAVRARDPLVFAAEREAMGMEEPPTKDEVEDAMLEAIQRRRNRRGK